MASGSVLPDQRGGRGWTDLDRKMVALNGSSAMGVKRAASSEVVTRMPTAAERPSIAAMAAGIEE